MKKNISLIISILLISGCAALFCFNILDFRNWEGTYTMVKRFYYQDKQIIGATDGVFLFVLGIALRKNG